MAQRYPHTPDGRYFVAKNRLWRCTNPALAPGEERRLVDILMRARRDVGNAANAEQKQVARRRVQAAKEALGERGPVWWDDDAPDETRRHPANSSYAQWWAALGATRREDGA